MTDLRFKCDCHEHELNVRMDDDVALIDVSLWQAGNSQERGLWHRLRLAWYVLRNGHCYADMVSLKPKEAHRLGKTLTHMAEIITFRERLRRSKKAVARENTSRTP